MLKFPVVERGPGFAMVLVPAILVRTRSYKVTVLRKLPMGCVTPPTVALHPKKTTAPYLGWGWFIVPSPQPPPFPLSKPGPVSVFLCVTSVVVMAEGPTVNLTRSPALGAHGLLPEEGSDTELYQEAEYCAVTVPSPGQDPLTIAKLCALSAPHNLATIPTVAYVCALHVRCGTISEVEAIVIS